MFLDDRRDICQNASVSWDEKQVKQLREQLKLGIGEFARLAGVDPRTVYRWEAGEAEPSGASEAVLNGLREKLRKDPDQTESISSFLMGAAAIGGLGYLIV